MGGLSYIVIAIECIDAFRQNWRPENRVLLPQGNRKAQQADLVQEALTANKTGTVLDFQPSIKYPKYTLKRDRTELGVSSARAHPPLDGSRASIVSSFCNNSKASSVHDVHVRLLSVLSPESPEVGRTYERLVISRRKNIYIRTD